MSAAAISQVRALDKKYYGVVQGIVTDVEDQQGKEGRVKVQFPWFDDQMETEWCRVRQFYAGNGYGAFFVPEKGDEVLVAFIHGDMRLPVILGGLYNGKDKPPSFRSSSQDQKMIRTKGQHEFLLDDSQGKERVRIKTKSGHTADLSDFEKKVTVQTSGGQSIVLDDSAKTITVETTGQSITINGTSGEIKVTGQSVTIEAPKVSLGMAASQSLVLGELFSVFFNTHTHLCTAPATPSSPPVVPMTPALLSLTTKTS
jgi:phage baseplate assembly protein V